METTNGSFLDAGTRSVLAKIQAGAIQSDARQNEVPLAMANILVNMEKGIEIAAGDVLKWLGKAHGAIVAAPTVIAALATLVSAVERPLLELSGVAANPLNIALDIQTANDLKIVWPDVKKFLETLGVKF